MTIRRPQAAPSPDGILRRLRRSEARARESEARTHAILHAAIDAIITIDEHGIVKSFNPAAQRLFGYTDREMIGQSLNRLMPEPHCREHDAHIARYVATGQAHVIGTGREVVGQRRDGTLVPLELSLSEVRLGRRRLFTGILRDITERKHLEREILEASAREQRRIGHDLHDGLGQHLTGLAFLSQVLAGRLQARGLPEAEDARHLADLASQATAQAKALARGLSPVPARPGGFRAALADLAATTAATFAVRCRVLGGAHLEFPDPSVATHLYRIAQEAIHNAVRHGKATRIDVHLRRDDGQLCLTIEDDGVGLPAPLPSTGGMGLRIMSHRARLIGAVLYFGNRDGRGARVSCALPAVACAGKE